MNFPMSSWKGWCAISCRCNAVVPEPLIATKRKLLQFLSTLLLLLIPFLRGGGESLLRLDAPTRTLLFFGSRVRIEEFFLLLLVMLIMVSGFLLVTLVLGRVWCGWFCPQTTITDLADYFDQRIGARLGQHFIGRAIRQLSYFLLALLVGANLVWYFISPYAFFTRLLAGELGGVAAISLLAVATLVYLDLALVRRFFCRLVCPYGRIQLMLMDENSLTLEFDPADADRCILCRCCETACPMGIDIKLGLQVECINCGRCLDACRKIMDGRVEPGVIHYTFGRGDAGKGGLLSRKVSLLAGVVLVFVTVLVLEVVGRNEATIKVARGTVSEVKRLNDGAVANFYTAYLENRSAKDGRYDLFVTVPVGGSAELLGPVQKIWLPANENRRVAFAVRMARPPAFSQPVLLELRREGRTVATAEIMFIVQ